jgi:hypothetical protein
LLASHYRMFMLFVLRTSRMFCTLRLMRVVMQPSLIDTFEATTSKRGIVILKQFKQIMMAGYSHLIRNEKKMLFSMFSCMRKHIVRRLQCFQFGLFTYIYMHCSKTFCLLNCKSVCVIVINGSPGRTPIRNHGFEYQD